MSMKYMIKIRTIRDHFCDRAGSCYLPVAMYDISHLWN